jgi:hypothetical protein
VHRVKGIKYLEVFEGLPQGVRAGDFLETQVCSEILGGLVPLKYSKGDEGRSLPAEVKSSSQRTSICFMEIPEGRIEWMKFSMENSQRHESH